MNKEDLFKKIGLILNELNDQYDYLAKNPQQLNEIELDLFHANVDFLADHTGILARINKDKSPLEIVAAPEAQLAERDIVEDRAEELEADYYGNTFQEEQQQVEAVTFAEELPVADEEVFKLDQSPSTFEFILNGSSDEDKFEFEEKSVDELFNRPLSQEEENILAQKRKLSEAPIEVSSDVEDDEIGPEPFLVSKVVEEDFPIVEEEVTIQAVVNPIVNTEPEFPAQDPNYKPTLNDILAAKTDKNAHVNHGTQQLSDLKQGINLNDKLLYIKDLFNGYNLAYAEAIDLANRLPNFEAADNFFKKNYAAKNNWADKQATVDKFYALLNQRFK